MRPNFETEAENEAYDLGIKTGRIEFTQNQSIRYHFTDEERQILLWIFSDIEAIKPEIPESDFKQFMYNGVLALKNKLNL